MNAKPRIERAALEVFVDRGVDAATTKLIAAKAGVSEGAIYRHWKSKDELALGLFMATHRRLSDLIAVNAEMATGIQAKAAAVVRAYCTVADEDWLLFAFHLLQLHHFLPYYQEDGRDPVSVVEALIKRAMIDMELPPGDPRVIAAMAIGVITQTAQNKAYGRLGDDALSAHASLMTAAVQAVLSAR
ncbi:TetR/AcrR family transcriptional regulator [Caulobacter sp. UNC279MFTsu5.1]|uniref:TetR/AcrR family transcriptional regulator n=1 Tax=Caulobacter sp. UNC279MFTsu5.1 TaxID=1502775 RepID=UPI0008ED9C20|nr:TetR/AcrR family transcriptional regulator [Caulobacter sp. UNC279MFTsu5.1]SFK43252.1 transcriptional regulator, TetR family [Caulobacter sp. UNC279MFTsu5.1]